MILKTKPSSALMVIFSCRRNLFYLKNIFPDSAMSSTRWVTLLCSYSRLFLQSESIYFLCWSRTSERPTCDSQLNLGQELNWLLRYMASFCSLTLAAQQQSEMINFRNYIKLGVKYVLLLYHLLLRALATQDELWTHLLGYTFKTQFTFKRIKNIIISLGYDAVATKHHKYLQNYLIIWSRQTPH